MNLGRLFIKDGAFSKTSVILVMVWIAAVFKWVFQGSHLIVSRINLDWTITFNSGDAIAMTGAASTLYFAVHNLRMAAGKPDPPQPGG